MSNFNIGRLSQEVEKLDECSTNRRGFLLQLGRLGAVSLGATGIMLLKPEKAAAQNLACNCVLYARSLVPTLPFGLHTQRDKARIINSSTPRRGSVAIHSYNHVSVVTRVETINRSTVVTITEANYVSCRITTRRDTPARLGIVGYFGP